ncbi:MAG: hypothetical protein WCG92_01420 [Hyphomicrobiales bacterium]
MVAALMSAVPAFAHEVPKGPNGGRIADAGEYHVEVVAKANVIEVFLSDASDKPLATAGFKGVAILLIDGKQQRVALDPTGTDRLSGKLAGPTVAVVKGVVQLTTPKGNSVQARFK